MILFYKLYTLFEKNFVKYYQLIFNFYVLNFKNLIFKNIIINSLLPICNQKTYFTGEGKTEIGDKCTFGYKMGGRFRHGCVEIQARYKLAKITIGDNVFTNNNFFICSANRIILGSNILIGENVAIIDYDAHRIEPNRRNEVGEVGKVIIGNNVWIGNNVTILKNSEIGNNSVIATGAVVTGKFSNNVIIGGVPAKVIKSI